MKSVKMQNVAQGSSSDSQKVEKIGVEHEQGKSSSTPQSSTSSPTKSDETYTLMQPNHKYASDSSESEEDDVSEVESFVIDNEEDSRIAAKFLLSEDPGDTVDPETQARLEALLEAAGIGKLSAGDGKQLADPEVLRRLTSSVSCALDEAAAALTRMRNDNPRAPQPETRSLVEACSDGDVGTVRKLLGEGRSVHETTEDGESLLSLACSAGYYELAQVLLAMQANVEDRGIKGDCTPLMEAASAGHGDIVRLLISHDADVNAQSSTGNTPLMYACAGGHEEVVKVLLESGANVEDHNENGHTPLMEAASAGYVNVAKILLDNGAGINTHSNEFKESALTLACYKGHLEMVRFLLEAGADQEHKTDEMHTALMEASMDGHVEVARLLLDSGAQVNMPTDSFESPLTLAACGGHVDLAMLLIERGANIEEVNDEGYTPLMEAAREGHEEMVALLLSQGANINAQTEETQETALTLACCGGFLEVADFLIKAEADIEAGASTPLMEASQEGHLELVRYLLAQKADVKAMTTTSDTALTYACENGHTDVAELLLQYGADLEHESEGGRTPLMKACRAGHLCTVQFLISKNADVNRQTTNNDHTPLSLACAGGHLSVVEFLLTHRSDPFHKLKDNSTMLIEAAKGGHTPVVQLLLDYPHNIILPSGQAAVPAAAGTPTVTSGTSPASGVPAPPTLHQVPEAVRASSDGATALAQTPSTTSTATSTTQDLQQQTQVAAAPAAPTTPAATAPSLAAPKQPAPAQTGSNQGKPPALKSHSLLRNKARPANVSGDGAPCETVSQEMAPPAAVIATAAPATMTVEGQDKAEALVQKSMVHLLELEKEFKSHDEQTLQKQILEELQRVEEELQVGPRTTVPSGEDQTPPAPKVKVLDIPTPDFFNITLPPLEMAFSQLPSTMFPTLNTPTLPASFYGSPASKAPCVPQVEGLTTGTGASSGFIGSMPLIFQAPPILANPATTVTSGGLQNAQVPTAAQILGDVPTSFQQASAQDSSGMTAPPTLPVPAFTAAAAANLSIQDRPKAKPVSKKDVKNRALSKQQFQALQQHQLQHLQQLNQQLQAHVLGQAQVQATIANSTSECVAAAAEAKALLQQAGAEALQARSLLHQQAHTQHTLQQLHQIQAQLKQLEEAGVSNSHPTNVHQHLQKQLRALQQQARLLCPQVPKGLVELATQGATEVKSNIATKEDSGVDDKEQLHLCEQAAAFAEAIDTKTFESTEELLAALKMHVNEKTFEKQLDYQRAIEDALSLSLHSGQQQAMQGGQQPVGLTFPMATTPAGLDTAASAALQRLEYIPVKMQLKQNPENLTPTTSIQLSYQLPMVPTTVSLPASAFAPALTTPEGEAGLFTAVANAAGAPTATVGQACQTTQAQLQALSSRLSSFSSLKNKQLQLLPPQIAPLTSGEAAAPLTGPPQTSGVSSNTSSTTSSTSGSCNNLNAPGTATVVPPPLQAPAPVTQAAAATQTPNKKKNKKQVWAAPTSGAAAGRQTVTYTTQTMTNQQYDGNKMHLLPSTNPDDLQNFIDPATGAMYASNGAVQPYACPPCQQFLMDVDSKTDSNHDTALTLGCAGGHEELVELLLNRGADIEHRDKKGFTPLILAATAGHEKVVEILLNHGADIEAQSERTKDTPLSLACSGGRIEVVNLLLSRSANKEHRNVSDYTPLSLAASGGYVNIIKLLLNAGAEINSRTGSKLGISPLMLAAMNGHTAAVKLLLDMGSDINAQIETNRNTALTLACFQGRHEVVSLLLDRKANVEHRAKTGLTPLMEAASGGYVEVGRVLLDKGADVNAPPVPSSRDTALTIAADKGHVRFVELLLSRNAQVEVKNKKGNSPLWLAANGGHLSVIEMLHNHGADIDSQDNRKVSCLMAAFRKGHVKAVKWMVNHVTQFPSDQEMSRYISTISVNEKELLDKCQECVQAIRAAKDMQAAKASLNADILLEELDMEKTREETKKAAAARRRERKKKKKLDKKLESQALRVEEETPEGEAVEELPEERPAPECAPPHQNHEVADKEEGDSGIDANSQGSCSSNDVKAKEKRKDKKKKKQQPASVPSSGKSDKENSPAPSPSVAGSSADTTLSQVARPNKSEPVQPSSKEKLVTANSTNHVSERPPMPTTVVHNSSAHIANDSGAGKQGRNKGAKVQLVFEATPKQHPAERDDFEATGNESYTPSSKGKKTTTYLSSTLAHYCDSDLPAPTGGKSSTSPKQGGKREEGWKEVVRKYVNSPFRSKKVLVPANAISRVIGRGGSNINAIRTATGAHIEVDKQTKGNNERTITIKGSAEATKQAHLLISSLVKDPEADLTNILPKPVKLTAATSLAAAAAAWNQEAKAVAAAKSKVTPTTGRPITLTSTTTQPPSLVPKSSGTPATGAAGLPGTIAWFLDQNKSQKVDEQSGATAVNPLGPLVNALRASTTPNKLTMQFPLPVGARSGGTAPRLAAAAEKRAAAAAVNNTKTTMSYTTAIMTAGRPTKIVTTTTTQTFAAKLTETSAGGGGSTNTTPSQGKRGQQLASPKHPQQPHSRSSTTGIPSLIDSAPITKPFLEPPPPIPTASSMSSVGSSSSSANNPPVGQSQSQQQQGRNTPQQQSSQQPDQNNVIAVQPASRSSAQNVATPLQQYSLFNDSKTVWGCENDTASQKGSMNFASVAAAGTTSNVNQNNLAAAKFLENVPPMVDVSKAPGYRGNTMSSPVSSKVPGAGAPASSSSSSSSSSYQNPSPPYPEQSSAAPGGKVSDVHHPPPSQQAPAPPPQPQQQPPPPPPAPVVSQAEYNRHNMFSDRGGHHLLTSSASMMMEPPPQTQHHYTVSPSPGYDHQPSPALLKMVQHPPNTAVAPPNLHHQEGPQGPHHSMMAAPYASPPPPQPSSHYSSQTPMGSSGSSSAASLSPPSMHSRLNPRAPDFSSSIHMPGKQQQSAPSQQPPQQSQQQVPPPSQQSSTAPPPPNSAVGPGGLYGMPSSGGKPPVMMNQQQQQQQYKPPPPSNSYHRNTAPPPSHHQAPPPPQRWSMMPPPPTHHLPPQQDIMGFLPPGTNLANLPPELLSMENHHVSPTPMSPQNNNSPPCGSNAEQLATLTKLFEEQRRSSMPPRPIGTERNWKNYSTINNPPEQEWMGQDKITAGIPGSWNAGPQDRVYRGGAPGMHQNPMRLVQDDATILDNSYLGQGEPHAFLNGGNGGPMSLMPHGFMPFVGPGLGNEVGPDMLAKMEPSGWDANAAAWTKWSQ